MKCSQCKSKTLTKIELNDIFYFIGDTRFKVSRYMDIYACNKCGHLEFFDNSFNYRREQEKTIVEDFDKEINALIKKKEAIRYDQNTGIRKFHSERQKIEEEIDLVTQRKTSALEELEEEHKLRFW